MMSGFEKDLSGMSRMDGKLKMPRRKALETSLNSSSNRISNLVLVKKSKKPTPTKGGSNSVSICGSPGGVSGKGSGCSTPGRGNSNKTPGDRFIPARSGNDFERSRYLLDLSPGKKERMSSVLGENERILSYAPKAPLAPHGHSNSLKVLYAPSRTPSNSLKKSTRHIPSVPERILDAPELVNDYYLNLLDWSANNHLAVSLGSQVFLWNADNGEIKQLLQLADENVICSVKWIKEGNFLSVGTTNAELHLWDIEAEKRVRLLTSHTDRVSSLSWNSYILSSGSRSGQIHHSDVRVAQHHIASSRHHTQEVCGLAWSHNGRYLASGANDNTLNIWDAAQGECYSRPDPLHTFTQHQAAVKAVAWCPWQPHVLASGGGTADRCIKLWNCNNGTLLNSIDTKSQVCALLWSSEYKELVSSHGFANNEVTIWKYPAMTKTAELLGHTERVLHMALSPDGTTVVSAGADETLRLWKCFTPDPTKKKEVSKAPTQTSNKLRANIR
ncbi:cell division cycle protein 20 homolog [Lepeophtheirus salmonis]|uniref:cell division cycle protein 20 homolog n=1 Tax=Lepeophtheirus salmonis TaxID=72036 RepID=UPI001AEA0359|nr:cell division cycle protein 20 homolog [Lepeophtheirus salmonis]